MRVTVESCLKKVDNRFKLVLLAAKRAKDLDRGAKPAVAKEDDKTTIIAMREIAEEAISLESLENITKSNIVNRNNEMLIEEEEEFYDANADEDDYIDDEDDDINEEDEEDMDEEYDDNMIEEGESEYGEDSSKEVNIDK